MASPWFCGDDIPLLLMTTRQQPHLFRLHCLKRRAVVKYMYDE